MNAWKDHNHHTLRTLLGCLAARSCGSVCLSLIEHSTIVRPRLRADFPSVTLVRPNQDKIVILEEPDYRKAFVGVPGG